MSWPRIKTYSVWVAVGSGVLLVFKLGLNIVDFFATVSFLDVGEVAFLGGLAVGLTALLAEWTITSETVSGTTTLTMFLSGDSAFGETDGETRLLPSKANFDVERIDTATDVPEETMFTGTSVNPRS